ncbi:MAG: hypothetical protein ACYDH9_06115 [Limisphaerales bacterium]
MGKNRVDRFKWNDDDQELVPDTNPVSPHSTPQTKGLVGWSYCARTPARDFFLAYFEKDCLNRGMIRGATPRATYQADRFDARPGQWSPADTSRLTANVWGWITPPNFPSRNDWGLKLARIK